MHQISPMRVNSEIFFLGLEAKNPSLVMEGINLPENKTKLQ